MSTNNKTKIRSKLRKPPKGIVTATLLLVILSFAIFRYFLVFKYAYYFFDICGDGFYCTYPSVCGYADLFRQYLIPTWSFKMGMGQNIFPFLLRNPFDIIYYLFGARHVLHLTVYVEVLKICLSGVIFYKYLRVTEFSPLTSIVCCLFYAFCGFNTVGSAWFVFTFETFSFSLLLLGFELFLLRGKFWVYILAIFLYACSMPFNLYLYGVFLATYMLVRLLIIYPGDYRKWFRTVLGLAGLTIIGILLAGPFFVEEINMLLHSPRGMSGSGFRNKFICGVFDLADPLQIGTSIQRFFSNDILGSGSNFKGWDTILGAPLLYCGVLSIMMLPQAFLYATKKQKTIYGIMLVVWTVPLVFPFFRRAYWLFTGDYYRAYGFLVSFVVLWFAAMGVEKITKNLINIKVLVITTLILIAVVVVHPFLNEAQIDRTIQLEVIAAIVLYCFTIAWMQRKTNATGYKWILVVAVIIELYFSGYISVNRRDAFQMNWLSNERVMYNSHMADACAYVKTKDPNFFRVDKNFVPATSRFTDLNYYQYQSINGTSSYHSFNNANYIGFLQLTGNADPQNEADARWAGGLYNSPIAEALNSVRYFFVTDSLIMKEPAMWDSVAKFENVVVYRNKYTLPFGYSLPCFIKNSEYFKLDSINRLKMLTQAVVVGDDDDPRLDGLQQIEGRDTIMSWPIEKLLSQSRDTLEVEKFDDTQFTGVFDAKNDELVYLSLPYDEGWSIIIDSKVVSKIKVDGGMTAFRLKKGKYRLQLSYHLPMAKWGLVLFLIGLISFILISLKKQKNGLGSQ